MEPQHFVGVKTTKIYCYPWCKAPQPKPENVTLYPTREEAERAGLRACRACFPHLPVGSWEDHTTHIRLTLSQSLDRNVYATVLIQGSPLAIRIENPTPETVVVHFEGVAVPPKKSIRIEAARYVWDWFTLGKPFYNEKADHNDTQNLAL